jgi:hypothetical protein
MQISVQNGSKDVFKPFNINSLDELERIAMTKTYSLGVFANNHRSNKDFIRADFIGLDFDGGLTINEAIKRFKDAQCIIAPTKSHQTDKNGQGIKDRFRVILKLEKPITNDKDLKATAKALLSQHPEADKACSDSARMFYASTHVVYKNPKGSPAAVVTASVDVKPKVEVAPGLKGKLTTSTVNFCLWGAETGQWNQSLYTSALDFKSQGYTQDEAIAALSVAARKELGNDGELDEKDINTISSAFQADADHDKRGAVQVFNFQRVGDLKEVNEEIDWTVDKLLSSGGISIIAGPPKSGKSTLIRQLSKSIAQGGDFLGRKCKSGSVLYLALEEQRSMLGDQLRRLGVTNEDPFHIHVGPVMSPDKSVALKELVISQRPALVVIDTLLLFMDGRDVNNYNEMYSAISYFREIARDSGCHIVLVHHTNKGDRGGPNSIMGSNAIHGSVDCALIFSTTASPARYITSSQRGGIPFENQPLEFNKETQTYELGTKEHF